MSEPGGTEAALRFAHDREDDLVLGPTTAGLRLRPRPQGGVRLDRANGLLDVDAALSLSATGRLARGLDVMLPLARPLPAMSVQEAIARAPFVLDALVSSADAITVDGDAVNPPGAPRAAIGPDVSGALATGSPALLCVRARLRVFERARLRTRTERFVGAREAAERIVEWTRGARAFGVDALREGPGDFVVRVLAAAPVLDDGASEPPDGFVHTRAPRCRSGRSLAATDARALAEALSGGDRVVAIPFMGRAGALSSSVRSVPVPRSLREASEGLAAALARGASEADHG
jgi:hypothetical protein